MAAKKNLNLAPVVLEGAIARLEPLAPGHLAALAEIAFETGIWRWMTTWVRTEADLERWMAAALAQSAESRSMAWVTFDRRTGRAAGSTRFLDIDPYHRTLEIGHTWLAPEFQHTGLNQEAKYLQLRHAFEEMGMRRVAFKTHHENVQSQRAIMALGAQAEGLFRNHLRMPDGSARHTMWFSIIEEDWPQVKARLEARMQTRLAATRLH